MFDRNPINPVRVRRSVQKLAQFGQGDGVTIGFNSGQQYTVLLKATPGLTKLGGLGILLDTNPGLTLSAAGLKVLLAATPGLQLTAGGLAVLPDPSAGLQSLASGLGIKLNGTASGLQLGAGGVNLLLQTNPGLTLAAGGLAVLLATNPGLQLTAGGLGVLLAAASSALSSSGGLSVQYDNSTIKVNGSNQLYAVNVGTVTSVAAGDNSITIGGTAAAPTVAVKDDPTGGLQTLTTGLGLKLNGTSSGLQLGAGGVNLLLATNPGLQLSASGLAVLLQANAGLSVGASGMSVNTDGTTIGLTAGGQLKALAGAGSPLTTKGDIYVFGPSNARQPVGGDGNLLMADSSQATGLNWTGAFRLLSAGGQTGGVTNTTTRTSMGFSYTLPANYMTVGRHVRCRYFGNYVALNTSQSFQLAAWLNGIGGSAGDGANPTCSTSGRFFIEIEWVCQTTGVNGTLQWGGYFYFETPTGIQTVVLGNNITTFNTTIANVVDCSCQWTVASASNSAALRGGTIEAY